MKTIKGNAGFRWTEEGRTVYHELAATLREPQPASERTTFRWRPVDKRAPANVVTVGNDAQLITARLRYDGQPQALDAMLRAGADGAMLEYLPDKLNPAEVYPCELESQGTVIELPPDPDLWFQRRYQVAVTLRRTDGGTFQGLTEGKLFAWSAGQSIGSGSFARASTAFEVNQRAKLVSVATGILRTSWRDDPDGVLVPVAPVEVAATNLLLRSQEFDNASWLKTDTTITANDTTAPDGTATADLLTEGSAGTAEVRQTSAAVTAGSTVAHSRYIRRGNHDWLRMRVAGVGGSTGAFRAWFNLATGAVGTSNVEGAGTLVAAEVEEIIGGWYRCTVVGSVTDATTYSCVTQSATADASNTRESGGTRHEWGAQTEVGRFPTSYVVTTDATAARPVETLSLPFTHPPGPAVFYGRCRLGFDGMASLDQPRFFQVGAAGGSSPFIIVRITTDSLVRFAHSEAGVNVAVSLVRGTWLEWVMAMDEDGAARCLVSIDGGAPTANNLAALSAGHASAYSDTLYHIGNVGGSNPSSHEHQTHVVIPLRLIRSATDGTDDAGLLAEVRRRSGV